MATKPDVTVSTAEFEKIPLEFIIATPLLTVIRAHELASRTTLDFVKGLTEEPNMKFHTSVKQVSDNDPSSTSLEEEISVPLLALVKIPSLNFDSLSVQFNYSISQVHKVTKKTDGKIAGKIGTSSLLSKFIDASFSGSLTSAKTTEMTSNRGGTLDIKVHISESDLPAGLQSIINAMVSSINSVVVSTTPDKP